MAMRIQPSVISGHLSNRTKNSISGQILVWRNSSKTGGIEIAPASINIALTGNFPDHLQGRSFEFDVLENREEVNAGPIPEALQSQQVGVIGDCSFRQVRVPLIPIADFYEAVQRGEQPPEEVRVCLFLEWFSQNDRVVLDIIDPLIQFTDDAPPPTPTALSDRDESQTDNNYGLSFAESTGGENDPTESFDPSDDEEDEADDPYNLFPTNLEDTIQKSAWQDVGDPRIGLDDDEDAGDASEPKGDEGDALLSEYGNNIFNSGGPPPLTPENVSLFQRMDEIADGSEDVPMKDLIDWPSSFPTPKELANEQQAWQALNQLLSAMALYGVGFSMCEHLTAQQAYRMLAEELEEDFEIYPEMVESGYVEHFDTWHSCPECQAEFGGYCDDDTHGDQIDDSNEPNS